MNVIIFYISTTSILNARVHLSSFDIFVYRFLYQSQELDLPEIYFFSRLDILDAFNSWIFRKKYIFSRLDILDAFKNDYQLNKFMVYSYVIIFNKFYSWDFVWLFGNLFWHKQHYFDIKELKKMLLITTKRPKKLTHRYPTNTYWGLYI